MYKLLAYVVVLFGLVSCAFNPPPPTPEYTIKTNASIGVFIEVGDRPYHKHIGTTIFNNFDKKLDFEWNVSTEIKTNIVDKLKKAGFKVDLLSKDDFSGEELAYLIVGKDKKWVVNEKYTETYRKLKEDKGYDVILTIREMPVTVISQCGAYGCTYFGTDHHGLFTRSFFGLDSYNAVYNFNLNLLLLDDLMNFGWGENVNEKLFHEVDMEDPKKFDEITPEEIEPIRDSVIKAANNLHLPVLKILKKL